MVEIHFQANYLPRIRKFKVEVSTPQHTYVELMTKARFIRFARAARKKEEPLRIAGVNVNFEGGNPNAEQFVRDYFKKVADSYIEAHWKKD